jgi:hypothetical protein
MRRAAATFAAILLALWAGGAEARAHSAKAKPPVVVELFTSQDCSSCVAADKVLNGIADRPGVLALTLAVDYWNYLGWKDTFAKPEFSVRQRAYMKRLGLRELYLTPQVIVDGQGQTAGSDEKKIDALIRQAQRQQQSGPKLKLLRHGKSVSVGHGAAPKAGADVWLVRYDPSVQEVSVKSGENRGQTLAQRNVVRELVRLGVWSGKERTFAIPAAEAGSSLKSCILVQAAHGGRILGVLET